MPRLGVILKFYFKIPSNNSADSDYRYFPVFYIDSLLTRKMSYTNVYHCRISHLPMKNVHRSINNKSRDEQRYVVKFFEDSYLSFTFIIKNFVFKFLTKNPSHFY